MHVGLLVVACALFAAWKVLAAVQHRGRCKDADTFFASVYSTSMDVCI